MLKNMTIKAKLLSLALITILFISISLSIDAIYSINKLSNENIAKYEKEAYYKKEKELENYISLAYKTIESYYERTSIDRVKVEVQSDLKKETNFLFSILEAEYNSLKDTLSNEALQYRLKSIINATRYGENGYFWVNDINAVIVTHPIKPTLNGKDMIDYKDKGGKRIFFEFAKVAKENGDGFVDYVWPKPGFETPQPKVSYVKLFKPFGWVIGTGEYVDDVTSKLQEEAKTAIKNMRYGTDGYFWINDSKHVVQMHAIKDSLVGKDMNELKDPDGVYVYREIVTIANKNKDGGLVKYKWEKPGKKDPQLKFSYVKRFEAWDWIVGTGAYVDNIEEDVNLMKEKTYEDINSMIIDIIVFALIAIIVSYLIYSFLVRKTIIEPINSLKNAVDNMTSNNSSSDEIEKTSNDEIGKLVDSFNGYVGKLKAGYEEDAKVIEEVDQVIEKVNNGFYVYKINRASSNPLIVRLRDSINTMIDRTNENLVSLNNILIEYGNADFTNNSSKIKGGEVSGIISSIINSTNLVGSSVSNFLSMIVESGKKLNEDTRVLSQSSESLSSSANQQAASLEETAAAVEEITSIVKSNVQNINRMSQLANELNISSKEGETLASKTTAAMDEIDEQVKSINEAITVIDQIAFQTNILSLNAAVEAATAGEAGKGFAVVAQEVRNLASRSAEAAKEIKDIVESATTKANEGKVIANNMIGGYTSLNDRIVETIKLIENVNQASIEEEKGIIQINDAINSLDRATQINASSATTISNLASEVSALSDTLIEISDRAHFTKVNKESIKDIDLVFRVSKLKSDHIKFKNDNFNKLGTTNVSWSVTKCTDCNLGKWIIEQENLGKEFTKTSNWRLLKEKHELVHQNVQGYIDEDCKGIPNNPELKIYSKKLDDATLELFDCLDQVKIENKVEKKIIIDTKPQVVVSSEPKTKKLESTPTKVVDSKPKSNKVVTSTSKDDDEWESF